MSAVWKTDYGKSKKEIRQTYKRANKHRTKLINTISHKEKDQCFWYFHVMDKKIIAKGLIRHRYTSFLDAKISIIYFYYLCSHWCYYSVRMQGVISNTLEWRKPAFWLDTRLVTLLHPFTSNALYLYKRM